MLRKLTLLLAFVLWGAQSFVIPSVASARTPLSSAVIRQLRNIVELIPDDQPRRPARVSDRLTAGDALSTARRSFAELRFNDGSLARLGEQVVFRFVPNTRTFRLSNGTLLLLVPPGQGRTRIQTPNATAGIRGSALFIRYIPGTETTLIGALTDSGIEVANQDASQRYGLEAGQMAVIVEDRILRIYEFDLNTFYETSELTRGLNLANADESASRSTEPRDDAIAQVRQETVDAMSDQSPVVGDGTITNPAFIRLSTSAGDSRQLGDSLPGFSERTLDPLNDRIQTILEAGEIQSEPIEPAIDVMPEPEPPIAEPPINEPPVNEPPVNEPPVNEPPVNEPPVNEPPVSNPPGGNGGGPTIEEPPITVP
jgi:hypothetical protein